MAAGSSPLARGLHVIQTLEREPRRIIPARAGFTGPPGRARKARRDHPRSRGVYVFPNAKTAAEEGSSPLARGLPGGAAGECSQGGIIPARAGFTSRTATRSP